MADPFSTIIGQLANLVSFKSALRLLVIAGSIIICWVWVQPMLITLQIPAELLSTIIVVIGFSIGALITSIAFSIFDSIIHFISTKNEQRKKSLKDLQDSMAAQEIIIKKNELLTDSFDSYTQKAKSILLKLIDKDGSVSLSEIDPQHNDAFKGLLEGKIVLILKVIDKKISFCTINPIFKDTLKTLFDNKHKEEVNNLFEQNPYGLDELLLLFQDNISEDNHVFKLDNSVYRNKYYFQPVINHETYYDGEFIEDCNVQFFINEHHYPFIVEKQGCALRSYILCLALEE